jgi:MFS family permease
MVLSFAFLGAALIHSAFDYAATIVLSGFGLSLVQAFLIPSLHLSATRDRPHAGIANYSFALSLGTVVGPLAAAATISFYGFSPLFLILSAVSVVTFVVAMKLGVQRSFEGEDTRKAILPSNIIRTMRQKAFASFYLLNFLYSLLLPILLSYGGIFAETKFGIAASNVLAIFAGVFVISSGLRLLLSRTRLDHFRSLLTLGFLTLFLSFLLMASANTFSLFLFGFFIFAIPHALVYPITTFMALESAGKEAIISSTYIFATSSGIAEFISPLAAVSIIILYNFSFLYLVMTPIALVGLVMLFVIPNFGSFFSEQISSPT